MVESGIRIADRYILEQRIATGGMGAVWRGRDARLDRPVAVKLLRNSIFQDNDEARQRFEREARAAARLKGAGFAVIHDHGSCLIEGEDVAYLVMELVEGEALSALIDREERLSPEWTMTIVGAVADTLRVVHREGIVHRDIKPGNILIEADGTVKLVDFGIARIDGATSLTATGEALGTLYYASPEQIDLKKITAASDLYSLGAVAYECLAGEPPFTSDDGTAVVAAHLSAEPPPLPREVPPQVVDVVMKALAKAPEDRWASAEAFAEACRTADDGDATVPVGVRPRTAEPPPAEPAPPTRRAGLWSWRFGFVAMTVAAILLLTALFAFSPLLRTDGDSTADEGMSESAEGGDSPDDDAATASGAAVETPSQSPSSGASPETGTDPGDGESGGESTGEAPAEENTGGDSGGEDTGGGSTDDDGTGEESGGSATLPNLWSVNMHEAEARLIDMGFSNIRVAEATGTWFGSDLEECDIVHQNPEDGSTASFDDEIVIAYFDPMQRCG